MRHKLIRLNMENVCLCVFDRLLTCLRSPHLIHTHKFWHSFTLLWGEFIKMLCVPDAPNILNNWWILFTFTCTNVIGVCRMSRIELHVIFRWHDKNATFIFKKWYKIWHHPYWNRISLNINARMPWGETPHTFIPIFFPPLDRQNN